MSASDLHEYYNLEIGGDTRLLKLKEVLDLNAHYTFPLIVSHAAPIQRLVRSEKDEWTRRSLGTPRSSFLLRHTQVLIVQSPLGATREWGQRLSLTSLPLLNVLQTNRGVTAPCRGSGGGVEFKAKQAFLHCKVLNDECEFNTVYSCIRRSGIFSSVTEYRAVNQRL